MQIIDEPMIGLKVIEPKVFGDARGYFLETYVRDKFAALGIEDAFVQDNESYSAYGVLRGLHYQMPPFTQAKLVRVIEGEVLDVTLDLRRTSPSFGKTWSYRLDGVRKQMIYVPRGFAHGFVVLSKTALFSYKCDNIYAPLSERCVKFDDPKLGINWQIPVTDALLSEKDRNGLPFESAEIPEDWQC